MKWMNTLHLEDSYPLEFGRTAMMKVDQCLW